MNDWPMRKDQDEGGSMAWASDGARVAAFGLFSVWLFGFALSGELLGAQVHMHWFVLPHALCLLAWAWKGTARALRLALGPGVLLTALTTVVYVLPANQPYAAALMALVGVAASPLSVLMGLLLKAANHPIRAAALGLVAGNLSISLLMTVPVPQSYKLAALGCALPFILLTRTPLQAHAQSDARGILRYVPFIFLFEVVGGMVYGQIWPDYVRSQWVSGAELGLYALSVLLVLKLRLYRFDWALLLATVAAIEAFALSLAISGPVGAHLMMYVIMMAAGLVDVLVLSRVLACPNVLRAFGLAEGTVAAGLLCGYWLVVGLEKMPQQLSVVAMVALNLAALTLFALQRKSGVTPAEPAAQEHASTAAADATVAAPVQQEAGAVAMAPVGQILPPAIADKLSEQECRVLSMALCNQPYSSIGQVLGLSESSIKTYMQRIFRKLGIYRRSQLHKILREAPAPAGGDR